jgi:hypothetical protein
MGQASAIVARSVDVAIFAVRALRVPVGSTTTLLSETRLRIAALLEIFSRVLGLTANKSTLIAIAEPSLASAEVGCATFRRITARANLSLALAHRPRVALRLPSG